MPNGNGIGAPPGPPNNAATNNPQPPPPPPPPQAEPEASTFIRTFDDSSFYPRTDCPVDLAIDWNGAGGYKIFPFLSSSLSSLLPSLSSLDNVSPLLLRYKTHADASPPSHLSISLDPFPDSS
ncbi:hypothetical protein FRB91_011233 [Serendipita sp. 411]|nr:hypothetical protein FRB91_011233 [Serendipita sp. 411]